MEEADDVRYRYKLLVRNMASAQNSVVGIKESMFEHTKLLWILLPLLFYTTLTQFHDSWEGDMWAFPDHDWLLHHDWVHMVDEMLGPSDDEGYLLAHFYNDSETPRHGPSSHASNIRHVLESHWETTLLTWALHLNFFLPVAIFVRYLFFYTRQSLFSIFLLMWFFMFSTAAQCVAVALRLGVIIYTSSGWAWCGLTVNAALLSMEALAYIELYRLRALAMFMNKQHANLPEQHQQSINEMLRDGDEPKDDEYVFGFVDKIIHILSAAKHSILDDSTARRYNLPKEKMQ